MALPPAGAGPGAAPAAAELGRLRWRCRRGMKELDLLLRHWLDCAYPAASAADRLAFEQLLERQDPELAAWFLGRERPADPAVARLVDAMLAAHR
jgi:antitoxin CptB